jgi:hypothetical protein
VLLLLHRCGKLLVFPPRKRNGFPHAAVRVEGGGWRVARVGEGVLEKMKGRRWKRIKGKI